LPSQPDQNALKRAVAAAAAERAHGGMAVGLGSGSTAELVVRRLGERVRGGLDVVAIPTSERTAALARREGIRLTDFAAHPRLDLTIDGADQVARGTLDLIKGRGGALLREKIVADCSDRLLIVVDASKLADRLGIAVPVEVVPFGLEATARKLERMGAGVARRLGPDGAPYVTDGGNAILDCDFGPIAEPGALEQALRAIVGVVECGLFVGRATEVLVADAAGVHSLTRERNRNGQT
jgi:ribose 5-phosphate isomerase A